MSYQEIYQIYSKVKENLILKKDAIVKKNLDDAERCLFRAANSEELYAKAYYSLARLYALKCEEEKVISCLKLAIDKDKSYVEKAVNEPIFSNIKDFIIGLNMLSEIENSSQNVEEAEIQENINSDVNITENTTEQQIENV